MTGSAAGNRSVSTVLLILAGAIALHAAGDACLFYAALAALVASVWLNRLPTHG